MHGEQRRASSVNVVLERGYNLIIRKALQLEIVLYCCGASCTTWASLADNVPPGL